MRPSFPDPLSSRASLQLPDMPVTAWVFGEHRIVPTMNWFGVEVNPKKIDWLSQGDYEAVATEAINEAAGHGFITEFAKSFNTKNFLYVEGQFDTESLAQITNPEQFLDEMLMQGFPRNAQVQSLIQTYIPKPAEEELSESCKTDQQFYTWNIDMCLDEMLPDWLDQLRRRPRGKSRSTPQKWPRDAGRGGS